MIRFNDWTIEADGEIIARQFDNLTRTLSVAGEFPAKWEWAMLVQVGEAMDILPLTAVEGTLSVVLTAQQLSIAGYYTMQLRGTHGELVKHTNAVNVYIPASLSGDKQWPEIPSEFTELEQRVKADADRAEAAAKRAEGAGGGGSGAGGVGGYYTPSVTRPAVDTMQVSFTPSAEDMPAVPPVSVVLPAGPAGKDGQDGAPGKDGAQGPAGADGYTPQKGVDYYTDADKQEIAGIVGENHYTKDETDRFVVEINEELLSVKGYVELVDERVGDIDAALDAIIALQESYIGGGSE